MFAWLRRKLSKSHPHTRETVDGITHTEFMEKVGRLALRAGLSGPDEALRKLESGELDGTLLETELRMLKRLEEGPKNRELTPA